MDAENDEAHNAVLRRNGRNFYTQNPNANFNPFAAGFGSPLLVNPAAFQMGMMLMNQAFTPGAYSQQAIPAAMTVQGPQLEDNSVDELILIDRLFVGEIRGLTPLQSIRSLATPKNPEGQWKDIYIDRKTYIDGEVRKLLDGNHAGSVPKFEKKKKNLHITSVLKPHPSCSLRHTISPKSKSNDVNVLWMAPKKEPVAPIHDPATSTPPSYTNADDKYIVDFFAWELKRDPSQSKTEICAKIASKATYHNSAGWSKRASKFSEITRMLSQAAKITSGHGGNNILNNESEDSESEGEGAPLADLESTDEEGEGIGQAGEPYTLRERRIIGKRIAEHSKAEWEGMSMEDRWSIMRTKLPHREIHAVRKYYMKNSELLDAMAEKHRKRRECRLAANWRQ